MITCIIIEDQPPAQRILQKFINDVDFLALQATFSDALEALQFLKANKIDVLFLDIHLPKISGIDFIEILEEKPKIILTTAFSEYALKGYELDVVDYLLKPFSFERFLKAVTKVNQLNTDDSTSTSMNDRVTKDYTFIKSGHELIRINYKDIMYIEASSDYTEVYLLEKKILTSLSLKNWLQELPNNFTQIHKSYIINSFVIEKVVGNLVYLNNSKQLPIGRAYKERFVNEYL